MSDQFIRFWGGLTIFSWAFPIVFPGHWRDGIEYLPALVVGVGVIPYGLLFWYDRWEERQLRLALRRPDIPASDQAAIRAYLGIDP